MDTFKDIVALIGAIAGFIVLLSGAFVFVKGSYTKARIEALREDNEDLRARVKDLEDDLANAKAKEEALEVKVQAVSNENKMLADMITQRANVEALLDLMTMHHREAMVAWGEIKEAVKGTGQ